MRSLIKHHIGLTNQEKSSLWESGTFVFDTNVLLQLYQCSKTTRTSILEAFEHLNKRIWIPAQVALEFALGRDELIWQTRNLYKILDTYIDSIKLILLHKERTQSTAITRLLKYNQRWIKKHLSENGYVTNRNDDHILDNVLKMFSDKVGDHFDETRVSQEENEAQRRIKENIPPGYKDKSKSPPDCYGDYFIWRQILDYAKSANCSIIFVTSDEKDDWWNKIHSEKIGPRVELLQEFEKEVGQQFHIYTLSHFLNTFSETIEGEQSKQMIKAAEEVAFYERIPIIQTFEFDRDTLLNISQSINKQMQSLAERVDIQELNKIKIIDSHRLAEMTRIMRLAAEQEAQLKDSMLKHYKQLQDHIITNYPNLINYSKRNIAEENDTKEDNLDPNPSEDPDESEE